MVRFDPTVPVDGAEHAILALAAREQEGCVPCSDRAHRRRLAQQLPPMLPSWPRSCDRRTSLFISSRRYFEREPQGPRFTSTGRPHRSASDLRRLPSTFSGGDAALLYYGLVRSRAVVQLGQLDNARKKLLLAVAVVDSRRLHQFSPLKERVPVGRVRDMHPASEWFASTATSSRFEPDPVVSGRGAKASLG